MTTRIGLIRQLDVGSYRVELESKDSKNVRSFVFTVEGQDHLLVVKQPPEFAMYMKHQMQAASPLMEAVLAFHRAQNLRLPD
jgi:hypothetical protein